MDSKQKAYAIMQYSQLCELLSVPVAPEVPTRIETNIRPAGKKGGMDAKVATNQCKKCMVVGL